MTDLCARKAASGKPPPIDFARQIMSGLTPKYSEAPPHPSFAPVFTSSKISNAPFLVAISRRPCRKARLRHAQADVHQDRFQNDGRDLAGILLEAQFDTGQIVEGSNDNVSDRGFRHSQPAGNRCRSVDVAVVGRVRLHADQRGIVQAVVTAFKLYDLVASGSGTGQADGVHGGFGTAIAEAHHLDRKTLADFFRQLPLHIVRHAEHGAGAETLFHCLHHGGMAMPGHERAETEVVIDVFVAIEVAELAALSFFHKNRVGIVSAVVAGDAQRNTFEVLLVSGGGLRRATLEGFELFLQCGVHRVSRNGSSRSDCGH